MNTASLAVVALCCAMPLGAIHSQVGDPPLAAQKEGQASAQFDQSRWKLVKRSSAIFHADSVPFHVLLLKSRGPTATGGVGQLLNDVELLVLHAGRTIYDYTKGGVKPPEYNGTRFFVDDYLEIRDVTGDGIPEILFHSGYEGASDAVTLEHILRYDKSRGCLTDTAPKEFYQSGTHGLRWKNRKFVVVASRNWSSTTPTEERCHYCPSPFKYEIYEWSTRRGVFVVYRRLYGKTLYEEANEALNGDWALIENVGR